MSDHDVAMMDQFMDAAHNCEPQLPEDGCCAEVRSYVRDRRRQIEAALSLDGAMRRLLDAKAELPRANWLYLHSTCDNDPRINLNVSATSAADLAQILRTLAKHGFHQVKGSKPRDFPSVMWRVFNMTENLELNVSLAGANCRKVEVGTEPVYAIECGEA